MECKVIAISNGKGGVGKTSNAVNLAGELLRKGKKVLLLDLDQNDHMKIVTGARGLITRGNDAATMLKERLNSPERIAVEVRPNLFLIPSGGKRLTAWEAEAPKTKDRYTVLSTLFENAKDKYDYIIIDSSPTLNVLHANIAYFANYFIIPCDTDMLSVIQTSGFIRSLSVFASKIGENKCAKILGVLPVKYDSRRTDDELSYDDLKTLEKEDRLEGGKLFKTLRYSANMKTSQARKKFLYEAFPKGKLTEDFRVFAEQFLKEIKKRETHPAIIQNALNVVQEGRVNG